MKALTAKQLRELDDNLKWLKKTHPRRYGRLEFHLSDMGNRIMLGIQGKGMGFLNVTGFMDFEGMWNIIHYLTYPIDNEINNYLKFLRK